MAKRPEPTPRQLESYWLLTRRPLLSLWFVLPALLLFHIGALFQPTALRASHDVLRFLNWFGAAVWCVPPLVVALVLSVQAYLRHDPMEFRPRVLGVMALESIVWAAPLMVVGRLSGTSSRPVFVRVLESVGAGIYEEFLFRMVLISLILAIFVDLLKWRKDLFLAIGVVVTAVLFSLYHFYFPGSAARVEFDWMAFYFLTAAGLLWGITYVLRGFGVAVGAHIAWNLYCIIYQSLA